MNTDTIDSIVEGISKGKSLNIRVSGVESSVLRSWWEQLADFKRSCADKKDCISCISAISRKTGNERMEISISAIPETDRQRLANMLWRMYIKDSPKIALF